jgi:phosphoglucosamine mutase
MSRKYFGTDGVRGRVGELPITPELIMHLGYAAGKVLAGAQALPAGSEPPAVLIGKDTRISGYMLESALQAGLSAAGVDIYLCGPMPTPAVAYLTRALRLSAGIVISASHNPFEDNGIKFFSAAGDKLPDAVEQEIEARLEDPIVTAASAQLGKARRINDAAGRYIEFCKSTFPSDLDLRGMKIVVDCAHGASYHIAPHVFHELGADVIAIGNQPDGLNINLDCGATRPQALSRVVVEHSAHIGLALDGDGDRLIMVDGAGRTYDGDQLLYLITLQRLADGGLKGGVVGTLMSNFGLERALTARDIPFARAAVGDRYVLEELRARGWQLGGENSGHIICLDKHTTGDGIVSALQVLRAVRAQDQPLDRLLHDLHLLPQVLINVRIDRSIDYRKHPLVQEAVRSAEAALRGRGRVLLRPSGTEPVVRVMVEGESAAEVQTLAEGIAAAIREQAAA